MTERQLVRCGALERPCGDGEGESGACAFALVMSGWCSKQSILLQAGPRMGVKKGGEVLECRGARGSAVD
eukprot:1821753-Prymnesium_polylepis.1